MNAKRVAPKAIARSARVQQDQKLMRKSRVASTIADWYSKCAPRFDSSPWPARLAATAGIVGLGECGCIGGLVSISDTVLQKELPFHLSGK